MELQAKHVNINIMLLDLLFPKACISCQKYGSYICDTCSVLITRHNQTCIVCGHLSPYGRTHKECQKHTPLDGTILATEYKNLTRAALHQIKYKMNFAILSEILDITLKRKKIDECVHNESFNLCTEVPMHQFKQNQRGFNQATLIAEWIEKEYSIQHLPLLVKTKQTTPQMQLRREERIFNTKEVFAIKNCAMVKEQKILLVDDVTTTASTLEECASLLKKAKAYKVWAIVLASKR